MSQENPETEKKPTVHVTSGGRVWVDANEQLNTPKAQEAMKKMEQLFDKLGIARSADQSESNK